MKYLQSGKKPFQVQTVSLEDIFIIDSLVSQEGFWENIKYKFTRDSKVADKIKGLIANLEGLSQEQEDKLKTFVVDQTVPKVSDMITLCKFVSGAFDWSVKSLDYVKSRIHLFFNKKDARIEMRNWAQDQTKALTTNHNLLALQNLAEGKSPDGKELKDDQTYEELGGNKTSLLTLAKMFSGQAAGNKATMDKIASRFELISREIKSVDASPTLNTSGDVGVMISVTTDIKDCMKPVFAVFRAAQKGYTLIDRFLYHTNIVVNKL